MSTRCSAFRVRLRRLSAPLHAFLAKFRTQRTRHLFRPGVRGFPQSKAHPLRPILLSHGSGMVPSVAILKGRENTMTKKTLLFVIASLPFMAWAQSNPDPNMPVDFSILLNPGGVAQLVNGWTPTDLQTSDIQNALPTIWSIATKMATPTSTVWTVQKNLANGGYTGSSPCDHFTQWPPSNHDNIGFGHEMTLAVFIPCSMTLYDPDTHMMEAIARGMTNSVSQALSKTGALGFSPGTGLPMLAAKLAQDFFSAGGFNAFRKIKASTEMPLARGSSIRSIN